MALGPNHISAAILCVRLSELIRDTPSRAVHYGFSVWFCFRLCFDRVMPLVCVCVWWGVISLQLALVLEAQPVRDPFELNHMSGAGIKFEMSIFTKSSDVFIVFYTVFNLIQVKYNLIISVLCFY